MTKKTKINLWCFKDMFLQNLYYVHRTVTQSWRAKKSKQKKTKLQHLQNAMCKESVQVITGFVREGNQNKMLTEVRHISNVAVFINFRSTIFPTVLTYMQFQFQQ